MKKAALGGAAIGAVVPLLNLFQGELAGIDIGSLALVVVGAAFGGAVLFAFIAIVGNAILR